MVCSRDSDVLKPSEEYGTRERGFRELGLKINANLKRKKTRATKPEVRNVSV